MSYYNDPLTYAARGARNNPFRTYSNFIYPRTLEEVLIWAQWFWERNPHYRTSIQKVVSYFIAGLDIQYEGEQEEADSDAIDDFKQQLEQDYGALDLTLQFGIELAAMGNVFVSCERLFSRMLLCPECPWEMSLKALTKGVDYEWKGGKFKGKCPRCGKQVTYKVKDVPTQDEAGRKVRFVFRHDH